jgi:hypothetical protein
VSEEEEVKDLEKKSVIGVGGGGVNKEGDGQSCKLRREDGGGSRGRMRVMYVCLFKLSKMFNSRGR